MQEAEITSHVNSTAAVVRLARNIALATSAALAALGLAIIAATYGQDDIYLFTAGLTSLLLAGVAGAVTVAQHIHLATATRTDEVYRALVVQVEGALQDVLARMDEQERKTEARTAAQNRLLRQILTAEGAILDLAGDELAPRRKHA